MTAGQRHESPQAQALLDGFTFTRVIADRGYAGADFIAHGPALGSEAVIPPHHSAKVQRDDDTWLSRERHLVECGINKLKPFRRIFSRFDKLDRSYLGFVSGFRPLRRCARLFTVKCQLNLASLLGRFR